MVILLNLWVQSQISDIPNFSKQNEAQKVTKKYEIVLMFTLIFQFFPSKRMNLENTLFPVNKAIMRNIDSRPISGHSFW